MLAATRTETGAALVELLEETAGLSLLMSALTEKMHGTSELTRACRGVLADLERHGTPARRLTPATLDPEVLAVTQQHSDIPERAVFVAIRGAHVDAQQCPYKDAPVNPAIQPRPDSHAARAAALLDLNG